MDYATATPEVIGAAIAAEITRQVAHRPVDPGALRRVAGQIADIL